jgi:hypothetical protein
MQRSESSGIARESAMLLCLAVLVNVFTFSTATSAAAEPVWEGGRVHCRSDQQVRLVINYRGVLHIQWSEDGGSRHEAGPYYSGHYKTLTYDTGVPVVVWRAEAKPDNDRIPGNISDASTACI